MARRFFCGSWKTILFVHLIVLPFLVGCGKEDVQVSAPATQTDLSAQELGVTALVPVLYGVNAADDGLSVIDPATGSVTFIGPLDPDPNVYVTPIAMAVGPVGGRIFVWNNSNLNQATGVLLTVDRCTGLAAPVNPSAPPQGLLQAIAFSPDGRLFGLEFDLFEIDPLTGVRSLVGPLTSGRIGGADFDINTGVLYGAELEGGALYTINTDTGVATLVAALSEDVGVIGSIVFDPTGTLSGTGFQGPLGTILFDIDPLDGTVSNIRSISGGAIPQGMGYSFECGAVSLDIKPGSCPNPLNPKSKGILPVAILGTADFDASYIDVSSIVLEGVAPIRSNIEDVSGPVLGSDVCDCTEDGPDGYDDLTLKFSTPEIVAAIGPVVPGDEKVLTINGTLLDGTPFESSDCVVVVGGKKGPYERGQVD